MNNAVQVTQTFQEKMFERVRDNIGDLLSDEELKKIVETSLNKAFFEKEITNSNGYRSEKDPVFVQMIRDLLKESVHKIALEWFEENKVKFTEVGKEEAGKLLFNLMREYITAQIGVDMQNFASQLRWKGLI